VKEESEDAVDLEQEAEEVVASGKMKFDVLTAATVNITIVSDMIACDMEEATVMEEYTAFILSQVRDMWRPLVNVVMNFRVP
jgi:hypothetical protein